MRLALTSALLCALCASALKNSAAELDDAIALKNQAMAIFRANAGKAVTPELYADGIRKLERAEQLLEIAQKIDPQTVEPLQREVTAARFWAQRFATVNVADALKGKTTQPPKTPATPPPTPPVAAVPEVPSEKPTTAVASALSVAVEIDKSAADLMKEGKYAEASTKLLASLQKAPKGTNNVAELGDYFFSVGRYNMALEYYKIVVKDTEKQFGPAHPFLALDLNKLALTYVKLSMNKDAEPHFQRVLAIRQKFYGQEDVSVAETIAEIGNCYTWLSKFIDAEKWLTRALKMREKLLKPNSPEIGDSHYKLGKLYSETSAAARAEIEFKKALEIRVQAFGENDPRIVQSLSALAAFYIDKRGKYDDAEKLLNQALAIVEQASGPEHPATALVLRTLAATQSKKTPPQPEKAKEIAERALRILEAAQGAESSDVAYAVITQACLASEAAQYEAALQHFERALRLFKKLYGEINPSTALAIENIATVHSQKKDYAKALPLMEQALAIYKQFYGMEHHSTVHALYNVAAVHASLNRYPKAVELFAQGLPSAEKALTPDHPYLRMYLETYESMLRYTRKIKEADSIKARIDALPKKNE